MVVGIVIIIKVLKFSVKVYVVEFLNVDDCYQFKLKGELMFNFYFLEIIVDGVKFSIGLNIWFIIRDFVDDIFIVIEDEIKCVIQLVWERMKLFIEFIVGVGVVVVLF